MPWSELSAEAPIRCYVTLLDIELGLRDAPEFFRTDEECRELSSTESASRSSRAGDQIASAKRR